MTKGGAESVVASAAVVTLASTSFANIYAGELPSGRTIAGGFLAFAIIAAIAQGAPEIGAGLALSVAGTAFTIYGVPVLNCWFGNGKGKECERLKKSGGTE